MMMKDKGNLEGQRLAAKTLVSLTHCRNELRQRVLGVLDEEIKSLYKQELDGIVASYLQRLHISILSFTLKFRYKIRPVLYLFPFLQAASVFPFLHLHLS